MKKIQKQMNNKKNNGITLIALVITIIVLLILAGVTIATLTGENGILTRASDAKKENEIASVKEQAQLDIANWTAERLENGEDVILNDEIIKKIIEENGYEKPYYSELRDNSLITTNGYEILYCELYNTNIRYYTEDGVPIPKDFYYVGGTKDEGVVISDNSADENKGTSHEIAIQLEGNQFVWVPVDNEEDFKTYAGYYNNGIIDFMNNFSEPYANGYENETTEYNTMKNKVIQYKGFYVGRYESGIESDVKRTSTSSITDDIVIMQGKNVYNYIGFSNSDDLQVETGGALQKSKEFAKERRYTSVESTLIYGIQWDAIMQWIDTNYKKQDGKLTSFVADSTGKGNYSSTGFLQTGASGNYTVKNIYDLGGNIWEWTMESYGKHARVIRGGYWYDTGTMYPSSSRNTGFTPSRSIGSLGFRVALYLI